MIKSYYHELIGYDSCSSQEMPNEMTVKKHINESIIYKKAFREFGEEDNQPQAK